MSYLRMGLRKVGHSLTARLLLIFVLASIAYWRASVYAFSLFEDTDYLRRIAGAHMALHTEYIVQDIGSPPNIERARAIVGRIPVDIKIAGPDVNWSSSGDFYSLSEIPFGPLTWLELSKASSEGVEEWAEDLDRVQFARYREHSLIKLRDGEHDIVIASPRIAEMPAQTDTGFIFALIGFAVLSLCYLAVRWVFQPIRWMQDGAARIGQGELDYRIPSRRHDELGDLSRDINDMADDVQDMLEAKRHLMLAISHELRSPITRSKVALAMLEDEKTRDSLLEDIDEMERLITDLLESEALNTRHAILHREPIDMGELLNSVLQVDFAHAEGRVKLALDGELPVANVDATRVRLLMRNLIDNALRYNPEGAEPVLVSARALDSSLEIKVRDYGAGIPPEHIEHVTEPFYRADPARTRATGGFGLGLYLCWRVVEVHKGKLNIESTGPDGTLIRVELPLHA